MFVVEFPPGGGTGCEVCRLGLHRVDGLYSANTETEPKETDWPVASRSLSGACVCDCGRQVGGCVATIACVRRTTTVDRSNWSKATRRRVRVRVRPAGVPMTTDSGGTSAFATPENCSDESAEAAWHGRLESQLYAATMVDRSVSPVWYAVGIVGNVLSALVWLQRRMRHSNSSAVYLATLSINDTLFLLMHVLLELSTAWGVQTLDYPVVCESFAFVYLVTQYLAPTLVLGFTVERFIAICYPYQVAISPVNNGANVKPSPH